MLKKSELGHLIEMLYDNRDHWMKETDFLWRISKDIVMTPDAPMDQLTIMFDNSGLWKQEFLHAVEKIKVETIDRNVIVEKSIYKDIN